VKAFGIVDGVDELADIAASFVEGRIGFAIDFFGFDASQIIQGGASLSAFRAESGCNVP
jgi:hypothetical protein